MMQTPAQTPNTMKLALAAEVLRSFGELTFVARGSSMLPTIFPGDILVVSREPAATVRCGHVVLVTRGGRFYAHRVVRKMNEGSRNVLITRGDALGDEDPAVPEYDLLGRVRVVVRGRKWIGLAEKPWTGQKLLQWAVRHSDDLAVLLLRWNSLRARIARAEASEEFMECI